METSFLFFETKCNLGLENKRCCLHIRPKVGTSSLLAGAKGGKKSQRGGAAHSGEVPGGGEAPYLGKGSQFKGPEGWSPLSLLILCAQSFLGIRTENRSFAAPEPTVPPSDNGPPSSSLGRVRQYEH